MPNIMTVSDAISDEKTTTENGCCEKAIKYNETSDVKPPCGDSCSVLQLSSDGNPGNSPSTQSQGNQEVEDVWAIVMDEQDNSEKFSDLSGKEKAKWIVISILKTIGVISCLYFFICSLGIMSSAFQILGGKTGGQLFTNDAIQKPITGLIIGILVTVLVQSSSTSTSIIITMTGAGILTVHQAIPIIMGSNIGTSVTNTIVSLTQSVNRNEFRKSFAGATVLDMFNFLTVLILLPIEYFTGYLEAMTGAIVSSMHLSQGEGNRGTLTDPVVEHVIQVNKTLIHLVAQEIPFEDDASMVKTWCEQRDGVMNVTHSGNSSACSNSTTPFENCTVEEIVIVGVRKCETRDFIFADTGMSDPLVGSILLVISLFVLTFCLIMMVKLLSSMLKGSVARIIKKVINTNFPSPFGWITGYLAIGIGAVLTFLVQSSSVFTSTMTPLVGIGVISLKRMYPLTLGANIGTTGTGIIAAFATDSQEGMIFALQLSLCHLFFNLTGILIWYPVPLMRRVPVRAAMALGNTTAKYRWFAVLYMICAFFLFPLILLGLSFAGAWVLRGFVIIIIVVALFIIIVSQIQSRRPAWLPGFLQTWEFLPLCLRSLEPYDKLFCRYRCNKSSQEDDNYSAADTESAARDSGIELAMENGVIGKGMHNEAFQYDEKITPL